jgi:hypothetical protein
MNWKLAIERWRSLPPEEQARIRRSRIPLNVAESMAFEGEPVELTALQAEFARLDTPPDTSKRVSAS